MLAACTTPAPTTSQAQASPSPDDLGQVAIAIGAGAEAADVIVAVELGFFAERGIEAVLVSQASGSAGLGLMATGEADVGDTTEAGGIVLRATGASIHIVGMGASSGLTNSVVVNESIQSPQEMQGKAIGFPADSSADDFFVRFVDHYDLDPSTIRVVNGDPPELTAALERGDIDGFFLWEPWPGDAVAAIEGTHVLQRAADEEVYLDQQYIYFGQRLIEDEVLGAAVLAAIIEGNEWLSSPDNHEEGAEMLSRTLDVDAIEALRLMRLWRWGEFTFSSQIEENVTRAQAYLLDAGRIAAPMFDLDDYLRPGLLERVDPSRVTD